MGTYPAGTTMSHGYPIAVPQYYATGPQDVTMSTSQHPHMLHHHPQQQQQHFELHQRQIEQMYHSTSTSSQSVREQQSSLQSGSTMIIPSPPNFDSFHPSNVGAAMPLHAMTSNPYMVPISTGVPESPQLQKARSQSPSTPGKMNPRAATFDPSLKSDHANSS
jgi:hypothetical protein